MRKEDSILSMLAATGVIVLISCLPVQAWSSTASHTYYALQAFDGAIDQHRTVSGKLPPPEQIWAALRESDLMPSSMLSPRTSGPPLDTWGSPFAYRFPGKHGEYDLYSYGPDGIDDDGARDDVSLWAEVNDGYHWKATWPQGRLVIKLGFALGLGCLVLRFFYSWRIVVPIAGFVVCLGLIRGCPLLMHPGVVPSRNTPLMLTQYLAAGLVIAFSVSLIRSIRKQWRSRKLKTAPAE
jgi:type II secretory pathway pseudopilin PulG